MQKSPHLENVVVGVCEVGVGVLGEGLGGGLLCVGACYRVLGVSKETSRQVF